MRLNVKATALAGGIILGLGLMLLTWWLMMFGDVKKETTDLISQVYIGYSISFGGSIVGLFWGFMDGLFGGFFFAWLYNMIANKIPENKPA